MVEGLVQKHGFDSALVSVDWLKMGARIQAREEEVVVAMRAWKLVEEPVVGHWTFVGASEDLLACRSDWVPVVDCATARVWLQRVVSQATPPRLVREAAAR